MKTILIFTLFSILISSCKKEETKILEPPKLWEKFLGNYHVYDTTGVFMFNTEISQYSSINQYGSTVDSFLIKNFADTMDLRFAFLQYTNPDYFAINFHDSVTDYNQKAWHISQKMDDPFTLTKENELHENTITLYYKMTNMKYCINEAVPFFNEDVKHVYVKY